MVKIDLASLGIKKPVELKVTNLVVEKVTEANIAVAKSYDMDGKDDMTIMQENLEAMKAKKKVLKDVLGLTAKQIKKIEEDVPAFDLQVWFNDFATTVFTVAKLGMTLDEFNKQQENEQAHTAE